MKNENEFSLFVPVENVAMVLNKINQIDGVLIEDDESHIDGKIKIRCKINIQKSDVFLIWLKEHSITFMS